jgi:outer membrane biogenesis lipoprotein LolB
MRKRYIPILIFIFPVVAILLLIACILSVSDDRPKEYTVEYDEYKVEELEALRKWKERSQIT